MQATTPTAATSPAVDVIPVTRGGQTVLVPSNQPLLAGDRVVTADKAVDVRVRNAAGTQEAIVRVAPNSEIVVGEKDAAGGAVADVEVVSGDAAFVDPTTEEAVTMAKSSKAGAVLAGDSGMLLGGALLGGALLGGALKDDGSSTTVTSGTGGGGNGSSDGSTGTADGNYVPPQAAVYDNVEANIGFVTDGGLTNDNTPSLNIGPLPAGATAVLLVNGQEVAATYDPATGLLTPNAPLPDGEYELAYKVEAADGTTTAASEPTTVTIDTATQTPTATVSGDGSTITGTAEPGSTVVIEGDNGQTITTTADENGNFSGTFEPPLTDGQGATITATDEAGNTSTPATVDGPGDSTDPTDPTDPVAPAEATLLSGASVTLDNLTDTVDTLTDTLGLNGVTDPLTQDVLDPLLQDTTALLDDLLIGTDGESGITGALSDTGDLLAASGDGTALEPVTDLLGNAVGNLGDLLNTTLNQDALVSETDSTTTAAANDLTALTSDLTADLDALLGTDTLVQDLLNPTVDSLADGTVDTLLGSGTDSTLLGGVDATTDNVTDVVDTLSDTLGLTDVTDPLTGTVDGVVESVTTTGDELVIGDGGLTDTLVDLGSDLAASGDSALTDTVGDLVTDLGLLADTTAETDVLSGETTTATGDIGSDLLALTTDATSNLDETLGTDSLLSDLLDPTVESLTDTTLTPALSGEETVATSDGSATTGDITQPLVTDTGSTLDDLLGGLTG